MSKEETKEFIVHREILYVRGHYIKSGTEGDVYHLTRKDTGDQLICKLNRTRDLLENAKIEASRLKSYHHKNIVRYVDSFVQINGWDEAHFLIMENCNGGSLKDYIKQHGGKEENAETYIKYFSDIVDGLVEIHSRK
jgi:serine/threonine protein kinase